MTLPGVALMVAAAMQSSGGGAKRPPQPPMLTAITACQAERDDAARLRCYDSAVGALSRAATAGSIVVVDREDVRKTRRSLFGFGLPRLPFFSGDNSQDDQPDELRAKVKSARDFGYNKWIIELDTGALWQTTEAQTRQFLPKPGTDIVIKKGIMGSYTLSAGGRAGIKAMRVR